MSLAGGFVDKCAGLCNPVMLQVSPMALHRIATYGADVVVRAQLGAWETFQDDGEASRRDIETARLKPHTFRIRNPAAVVLDVDVGNEVFAAALNWIEAVGETVEGIDCHVGFLVVSQAASLHRAPRSSTTYGDSRITSVPGGPVLVIPPRTSINTGVLPWNERRQYRCTR